MNPDAEIPPTPGFIPSVSEDGRVLTLHRMNIPTYDLEDIEKTYRAIKDECTPEELDYVLNDSDEYYSDRRTHLKNRSYSENGHKYKFANMKKSRDQSRTSVRNR
jgi:hypothetical protein